ncbi:MAG: lysA [Mucilaginibacter sp.]|nr:lysA [Mucilaginibacter sp.]
MFDTDLINRFQQLETPFYYYDMGLLRQTLEACKNASDRYGFHVHYAMKANFNPKVLNAIQSYGFGADCVSGNEVKAAIAHGFDKGKVVFAGVGKSDKEINAALDADIFCFNVESVQELIIINDLANAKNKKANVAIRINPNVDARTHHFITTGLDENKFGINGWQLNDVAETLRKCANLQFVGIHFHIGSQITDLEVYKSLCIRINEMQDWFEDHGFQVKVLNTGGGLGVDYHYPDTNTIADFEGYFKVFRDFLNVKPGQEVHFELGRAMVAQCSALVSRVLYVKNGQKKNFLVLDAGMTELIRPMLYQAYQKIENLSRKPASPQVGKSESEDSGHRTQDSKFKYDVVGPICESTDCFQKDVELPESFRGDLFAIRTAGAYGEVMASGYNLRDKVQSVYSE